MNYRFPKILAHSGSSIQSASNTDDRTKKISRTITCIALVMYALYHILIQYYSNLNSRLLAPSWNGIAALVAYESGHYESASRHWRRHYALAYDSASLDSYTRTVTDRISKEPDRIESYYLLADLDFASGKYADAAAAYQRALARRQDDYEAGVGLATCLVMQGEYKRSHELFARVLRQSYQGKNANIFFNILVALDKVEKSKNSDSGELYLTLAYLNRYLRIIDVRRQKYVLAYADKALARDGKLDEAYLCKGVMYLKENKYEQALAQFEKTVKINPRNADAYNRMGYVQGVMGNPEEELASYKKSVELENIEPVFAYRLAELLYKKYGDMRQASFYFKKALDLNPADYMTMGRYGYTLMLSGEYDKALEICANMIDRYPDRPYSYKLKADCYMGMKRYREAIEFYHKSHDAAVRSGEESELDFQAFTELGVAYTKLKRTDEAITAYQQALSAKPHDVNTLFNLQYLYRRKGKYEEAYAAIKEILRLQPEHGGAQRLVSYMERNVAAGKSR